MLSYMTPDFPLWADGFAGHLRRLRASTASLHQFEALFAPWVAHWRLAQQDEGAHSRDRCWNLRLVFWTFLWQVAQAGAACREAIRQAQALAHTQGRRPPPDTTSPYCQARSALPGERLQEIHDGLVRESNAAVAVKDWWCGRHVLVVDGTTLTAPDTPENQAAFPQQSVQKPGCGFPLIRLVALLSLATGMLTAWATGHWQQHEVGLLQILWEQLQPGHVLLGDRGFCHWALLAQCLHGQMDAVLRVKGVRRRDFRQGQRLRRDERLVQWAKPSCPARTVSPELWARLPEVLPLRLVRCRLNIPGFRTRQVILVTTLLDSTLYPPAALGQLYYRRWAMELTLRNLKLTLQMDQLTRIPKLNCHKERKEHKEKAVGLGRREKTWHGSEPTKLVVPLCVSLRSLRPTSEFGVKLPDSREPGAGDTDAFADAQSGAARDAGGGAAPPGALGTDPFRRQSGGGAAFRRGAAAGAFRQRSQTLA